MSSRTMIMMMIVVLTMVGCGAWGCQSRMN